LAVMAWLTIVSSYLAAPSAHLTGLPALLPLYWRVLLALTKPRRLRHRSLPPKVITTGAARRSRAFSFCNIVYSITDPATGRGVCSITLLDAQAGGIPQCCIRMPVHHFSAPTYPY